MALAEAGALTYLVRNTNPQDKVIPHDAEPDRAPSRDCRLQPRRGRSRARRHAEGRRGRRAISGKTANGEPCLGRRQAEVRELRRIPGVWPAGRHGRNRGLCPCDRSLDGCPEARGRGLPHGRHRIERGSCRLARAHQPQALCGHEPGRCHGLLGKDRPAPEGRRLCPRARPAREAGFRFHGGRLAGSRDPEGRRRKLPRRAPARAFQHLDRLFRRQGTGPGQPRPRRAGRAAVLLHRGDVDGRRPGSAAPEPRFTRGTPGACRRDGRAAWPRLARHPAA